jgi:hypothetical protein
MGEDYKSGFRARGYTRHEVKMCGPCTNLQRLLPPSRKIFLIAFFVGLMAGCQSLPPAPLNKPMPLETAPLHPAPSPCPPGSRLRSLRLCYPRYAFPPLLTAHRRDLIRAPTDRAASERAQCSAAFRARSGCHGDNLLREVDRGSNFVQVSYLCKYHLPACFISDLWNPILNMRQYWSAHS